MRKESEENVSYNLENCKSGQLFLSLKFDEFFNNLENQDEVKEITIKTNETEVNTTKEEFYEEIEDTYDSHENSKEAAIEYLDPVYFDDEYLILEKKLNSWLLVCFMFSVIKKINDLFQVVSPTCELP